MRTFEYTDYSIWRTGANNLRFSFFLLQECRASLISFYNWADDIRGFHPHLTLFVRMTSANEIWKKRISLGWMYRPHVTTNKCYALKIAFILKDNATNISESHHSKEKSPEEKSILGKRELSRVLCIYLLFITLINWFFGRIMT